MALLRVLRGKYTLPVTFFHLIEVLLGGQDDII
jgi:hypothetical protein